MNENDLISTVHSLIDQGIISSHDLDAALSPNFPEELDALSYARRLYSAVIEWANTIHDLDLDPTAIEITNFDRSRGGEWRSDPDRPKVRISRKSISRSYNCGFKEYSTVRASIWYLDESARALDGVHLLILHEASHAINVALKTHDSHGRHFCRIYRRLISKFPTSQPYTGWPAPTDDSITIRDSASP